jgi:quercetin dioxygenase-like cupin family protein
MTARVIRAGEGEVLGSLAGCRDRFLIDSKDWGGRFAVVEHLLAPHSIAAPMHRHTNEDEFSLILEGGVSYHAAGEELPATVGDLVFKPRGEWHTFWNATDLPARVLEMISPGGLEEAFRIIDTAGPDVDLGPVIGPYGCEGDMEATMPIIEKHGLTFG